MKMFDSVALACVPNTLDIANAIRASLELYRLRVHFYLCVQKKNVLDFLGGNIPEAGYVILCVGGHHAGEEGYIAPDQDRVGINFINVVEQVDGKWQSGNFSLRPDNISQYVNLAGRTVICNGCNTGDELLANAFLDAGCKAYIGPTNTVDQDSTALFTITFFYHLLTNERDGSMHCSDEEAVQRAAAVDPQLREGTGIFRYFSREAGS